jgi:pSer/pThr/pTyr-binding forkhead associated (FHA) protein
MTAGDRQSDPLAPHSLSAEELKRLLEAESLGGSLLVFRGGDGELSVFAPSPAAQQQTLGRRPEADLSIAWDPEVSGLHAELLCSGGEWAIVDDGLSRNGTYVNGKRIGGRCRLRDGDRIRIGQTVFAFKTSEGTAAQETVASTESAPTAELTETQRRVLVALCRPYRDGADFTRPATNQEIAGELFLSVEAVKMHLRTLFAKFELTQLAQNEKRVRLAERALQLGVVSRRELA